MKDNYVIREFEQTDISEISRLIQNVLGTFRGENYWKWKYFNNSVANKLSATALFNGEIVGLFGAIPVKFSINGKNTIAVQEVDIAILEGHRNFMLFLSMANSLKKMALAANTKFFYGISIEDTSEIAETLLGKTIIAPIPRLVKVVDIKPVLQQRVPIRVKVGIIAKLLNWIIQKRLPQKFDIPVGMVLKHIDRFDKRFDEFWDGIRTSYPIMVKRSSDYLNWRYVSHPDMKYKIVNVEQKETNKIMGYMVLGVKQKDYLIGEIVDLITPKSGDHLVERCLIMYAIRWFNEQKVAVIRCWMFPHCHLYHSLIKAGFKKRVKKGVNLIFNKMNLQNPFLSDAFFTTTENWFISIGDSDMD